MSEEIKNHYIELNRKGAVTRKLKDPLFFKKMSQKRWEKVRGDKDVDKSSL